MTDHAAAYRGVRERVVGLTAGLDDEAANRIAPATPEWRIKDLIAHMVGVPADVLAGETEGAGSDPWTARQVAARRDRSLADILAEWEEVAPGLEAAMPALPEAVRDQIVGDAVAHEHDLRGALDRAGARDSDAFEIGFGWSVRVVGDKRDGGNAGALRLRTERGSHVAGTGEVAATVTADRFELFRAMWGRRCPEQIAAYRWEGTADPAGLSFFPPRPTPLVE
jgi:uncharacterized protein (TIGR03083 family)